MERIIKAEKQLEDLFKKVEEIEFKNSEKIINAFRKHEINESHFVPTNGYGYDDIGRDTLDKIYAEVFGSEDAIVRHNIISGTHALSLCLFAVLRPNDLMLAVTGRPYDTLEEAIGIRGNAKGSLKDFGVRYSQVDLLKDGTPDYDKIKEALKENPKLVTIQRSKGYEWRKSIDMSEMKKLISFIKENSNAYVMVDNCYGEFVEETEPTDYGADLMAGSLIKNPGGGIAPTGGYIAGTKECIEMVANRLTSPGIGKECGASLGFNRDFYKGLFFAPSVVASAIKTAILTAKVMENMGYEVCPTSDEKRTDIIQAIKMNSEKNMVAYCQGIQKGSPVDSNVVPMPWDMPGYGDKVIMAAGAFTQGSSIELSADGPIKEPYVVYQQGGLTYSYGKIGLYEAIKKLEEANK